MNWFFAIPREEETGRILVIHLCPSVFHPPGNINTRREKALWKNIHCFSFNMQHKHIGTNMYNRETNSRGPLDIEKNWHWEDKRWATKQKRKKMIYFHPRTVEWAWISVILEDLTAQKRRLKRGRKYWAILRNFCRYELYYRDNHEQHQSGRIGDGSKSTKLKQITWRLVK